MSGRFKGEFLTMGRYTNLYLLPFTFISHFLNRHGTDRQTDALYHEASYKQHYTDILLKLLQQCIGNFHKVYA